MTQNNKTWQTSSAKASEAGRKGKKNSPWSKGPCLNTKRARENAR